MQILGCAIAAVGLFFFWGFWHAIEMYHIQGDPRWMMSIIACPIFGLVTIAMGAMLARS